VDDPARVKRGKKGKAAWWRHATGNPVTEGTVATGKEGKKIEACDWNPGKKGHLDTIFYRKEGKEQWPDRVPGERRCVFLLFIFWDYSKKEGGHVRRPKKKPSLLKSLIDEVKEEKRGKEVADTLERLDLALHEGRKKKGRDIVRLEEESALYILQTDGEGGERGEPLELGETKKKNQETFLFPLF